MAKVLVIYTEFGADLLKDGALFKAEQYETDGEVGRINGEVPGGWMLDIYFDRDNFTKEFLLLINHCADANNNVHMEATEQHQIWFTSDNLDDLVALVEQDFFNPIWSQYK